MNRVATSTLESKTKRATVGNSEREADYNTFNKWVGLPTTWFTRHIRVVKGGSATLQECHISYERFLMRSWEGFLCTRMPSPNSCVIGSCLTEKLVE